MTLSHAQISKKWLYLHLLISNLSVIYHYGDLTKNLHLHNQVILVWVFWDKINPFQLYLEDRELDRWLGIIVLVLGDVKMMVSCTFWAMSEQCSIKIPLQLFQTSA
ncbi:transmembrane protein, putative [Medicago truncatula]|uniref:Transmembrane protein, putative n=1 Tax=Medicago truncatula TaxID=3880 RepID=A0A072TXG5_MEDTR|nr:transmembrane protein, putative [Medicago truncatula]